MLRSVVAATGNLSWSQSLIQTLLEELYVDDSLEGLLGRPLRTLRQRQYPQAIAIALIVRHSWRADDLDCILKRLGIQA